MEDNTKVTLRFATKSVDSTESDVCTPSAFLIINTPDGKMHMAPCVGFNSEEISFGKDSCDVKFGRHHFIGDLDEYQIKVAPVNGVGVDLKLKKQGQSWRGDTGYIALGDNDEQFFTWLSSVSKGIVTGTITVDNKTYDVKGYGYHDHQWGNINHVEFVNSWFWSRQNTGDHSILVFDFVLNKEFGYKRVPLAFIQDRDGNIIFENTENVKCEILEEYYEENTKEYFPKVTKYTFENNNQKVEYVLTVKEVLENKDSYAAAPDSWKKLCDEHDARPTYGRYLAEGKLNLTDNNKVISECGELIYEFTYIGKTYKEFMEAK